jgi:hypothetical protein
MKVEETYLHVLNRKEFQENMSKNPGFVDRTIIQMNSIEEVEQSEFRKVIPHPEKINFSQNVAVIERRNFASKKHINDILALVNYTWKSGSTGYLLFMSCQLVPVLHAMLKQGLTREEIIDKLSK